MFVVTVDFLAAAGQADALLSALRENAARSLADEPGCRRFDVCLSAEGPGRFFLYELYADPAAFAAHRGTPHYAAFAESTRDLVAEKTVRTHVLDAG
jgi:quinol monooxygenase YgiN